jgi:hypothetical protein
MDVVLTIILDRASNIRGPGPLSLAARVRMISRGMHSLRRVGTGPLPLSKRRLKF